MQGKTKVGLLAEKTLQDALIKERTQAEISIAKIRIDERTAALNTARKELEFEITNRQQLSDKLVEQWRTRSEIFDKNLVTVKAIKQVLESGSAVGFNLFGGNTTKEGLDKTIASLEKFYRLTAKEDLNIVDVASIQTIASELKSYFDLQVKAGVELRKFAKELGQPLPDGGIFGPRTDLENLLVQVTKSITDLDKVFAEQEILHALQLDAKTLDEQLEKLTTQTDKAGTSTDAMGNAAKDATDPIDKYREAIDKLNAALLYHAGLKSQIEQRIQAPPSGGGPQLRARGGQIHGTDSVSALLSPGEFVVNAAASRKFYSQLINMNAQGLSGFARGGPVSQTTVGDINISMSSSGSTQTDGVAIGNVLRREIRRGRIRLG